MEQRMKMVRVKNINPVFFSLPQHPYFTFVQQHFYTCGSIDLQLCDKLAVTASPQMLLKHDRGCCYTSNHVFRASSSTVCDTAHYSEVLPCNLVVTLFTDGITNKLIGCYVGDAMDDVVLVRIYGNKTELLVDRDEEVKSFRVLQAHGCAPQLYCTFSNGLCYEFMQGEALDPEHVCNPDIFRLIARQLAKIHAIHAHNGWIPKSNMWLKMGKYFSLIPTEFTDEEVNKRFLSDVPSPQILQEEMAWMKERLSNLGSPVVLCHNDLLCKNIIYNEKQGDVQFIDYEYSGYNYLAYDIGNHFNEFAGVSEVDYSLYPDRELQEQWLRSYLEAYKEYKGFGTDVTEKEVEVLYVQVNQFALASHFFWGLWALIQAKYSTIDFDFLGYAIVRFNQYFKMKPEVTALKLPE
ncbi:ethanolamine kinase 1 [Terrapene carolina triunguis]|uniref:ethanolamine kinase 1 n=1 Tax=Terrapene triunguis TaxID=2587831 RepID=UPI000E77A6E7|nr:ethanolamine kinase 1 [Terrapene carolina triunguis]